MRSSFLEKYIDIDLISSIHGALDRNVRSEWYFDISIESSWYAKCKG